MEFYIIKIILLFILTCIIHTTSIKLNPEFAFIGTFGLLADNCLFNRSVNDSYLETGENYLNNRNLYRNIGGQKSSKLDTQLLMTRKATYGYRYNRQRKIRKGTVRSKIYFDMWKDKDPYYVIHKFLYENDPDNPNFEYDLKLATKEKCKRNIFAHYKKDNRLRFFWYASKKKKPKGPVSRYINFALERNEFRFSKLTSFFHILPYVHENFKDNPLYIHYMNNFLRVHGHKERKEKGENENEETVETDKSSVDLETGLEDGNVGLEGNKAEEEVGRPKMSKEERKELRRQRKEAEREKIREILKDYKRPYPMDPETGKPTKVVMREGKEFELKFDAFPVYGEYYSTIDKKNRMSPFDVNSPFLKTKHSSKRRRYRERRPLDPAMRIKTRRERRLLNRAKVDVKAYIQKFIKRKPKLN